MIPFLLAVNLLSALVALATGLLSRWACRQNYKNGYRDAMRTVWENQDV